MKVSFGITHDEDDDIFHTFMLHRQYSQAINDEQGLRLIGLTFNDPDLARCGIADTPGAFLVSRLVSDWR